MKEYALYKGDELLEFGTLDFIAKKLNIQKHSLYYYLTGAYQKKIENTKKKSYDNRRILIEIIDDELD